MNSSQTIDAVNSGSRELSIVWSTDAVYLMQALRRMCVPIKALKVTTGIGSGLKELVKTLMQWTSSLETLHLPSYLTG
jgi:hypothetical protein